MNKSRLLTALELIKYLLLFVMLILFINFNSRIAKQTESTNELAGSTNRVVKGQEDILKAIRQVTEDTRITADQQTAIIICMLQVPIESRTTDLQAKCRSQYVAPDGTTPDITDKSDTSSSSNNTPISQTPQRDKPQDDMTPQPITKPTPTLLEKLTKPVTNITERIL